MSLGHFRFLDYNSTFSWDLKWSSGRRLSKGLTSCSNPCQWSCWSSSTLHSSSMSSFLFINHCLVRLSQEAGRCQTAMDNQDNQITGADLPSIENLYMSRQKTSVETPHIPDITCSNCCLETGATEVCLLKPAATETVSFPRLSL